MNRSRNRRSVSPIFEKGPKVATPAPFMTIVNVKPRRCVQSCVGTPVAIGEASDRCFAMAAARRPLLKGAPLLTP